VVEIGADTEVTVAINVRGRHGLVEVVAKPLHVRGLGRGIPWELAHFLAGARCSRGRDIRGAVDARDVGGVGASRATLAVVAAKIDSDVDVVGAVARGGGGTSEHCGVRGTARIVDTVRTGAEIVTHLDNRTVFTGGEDCVALSVEQTGVAIVDATLVRGVRVHGRVIVREVTAHFVAPTAALSQQ